MPRFVPEDPAFDEAAIRAEYLRSGTQTAPSQVMPQKPASWSFDQIYQREASANADPYASQRAQIIGKLLREAEVSENAPREKLTLPAQYTPEMLKETTDRLRRNEAFGAGFQMFGDDRAAKLGQMLMSGPNADEFIQNAGKDEVTRRYQEWQMNLQDPSEKRIRLLTQALGAMPGGDGGQNYQKMPTGTFKDLSLQASAVMKGKHVVDQYKPEYSQVLGKLQGPLHSIIGQVNRLGWEGLVKNFDVDPKVAQDSVMWFAQLEELLAFPQRAAAFGLTRTKGEAEAWDNMMAITPSTNPEFIKLRLDKMIGAMVEAGRFKAAGAAGVYDPRQVENIFGGTLDEGGWNTDTLSGGSSDRPKASGRYTDPDLGDYEVIDE